MSTTQPIRSMEQLKQLKSYYLSEKPNARNYMLIIMGLNTALRISDILNLSYGDVYYYQKEEWKSHIVLTERKTGKATRIYMNQEIRNTLNAYTVPGQQNADSWLFSGKKNRKCHLSRCQAFRIIKAAGCYAGLSDNISCHSLRKTFGYHAWKQGVEPALLMNIYNHSTYQITKRYLCIDQDDKDSVFANIRL